jgi:bacterioferritin
MGTKGREIVGMKVPELVELLKEAFCDEWLAYYQYWVGAKVASGPVRGPVADEMMEHAADELKHAEMLTTRIIQLGGAPVLKPEDWYKLANCGYAAPNDPSVRALLQQNIKGERCAIGVYKRIMDKIADKDPVTYKMVLNILEDEIEHEDDLEVMLTDIEAMTKSAGKK